MFLRRHTKRWSGQSPSVTAFVAPGAHDLLAADAGGARSSGTKPFAAERRPSVSLQVTSSDLAVGSVMLRS